MTYTTQGRNLHAEHCSRAGDRRYQRHAHKSTVDTENARVPPAPLSKEVAHTLRRLLANDGVEPAELVASGCSLVGRLASDAPSTCQHKEARTYLVCEPEILREARCSPSDLGLHLAANEHPRAVHPAKQRTAEVPHGQLEASPVLRDTSDFGCGEERLCPVVDSVVVYGALPAASRSALSSGDVGRDKALTIPTSSSPLSMKSRHVWRTWSSMIHSSSRWSTQSSLVRAWLSLKYSRARALCLAFPEV